MIGAVKSRYSEAAQERAAELCCPVNYDNEYLKAIPQEVLERDYGCGDPSVYAREGDTILDLGSGGGKVCFIASQVVGPKGKVIGVDMTGEMLDLANRNLEPVAERIGYKNVEFKRGYIQDLKTDPELVDELLKTHPVKTSEDLKTLNEKLETLKEEKPLIPDGSVDLIVSNCVLNLVEDNQKPQLFREMFRVLKRGGRIAVSDIVSDEESPPHLKENQNLWSGCISGALQEYDFIQKLEECGFYGIAIDKYDEKPWKIVGGIEYRSVIITARKGKEGACIEKNQAVIYKGPWKKVEDDDGHVLARGQRMAVCEKTFKILGKEPYADSIVAVPPKIEVEGEKPFDCSRSAMRLPGETKSGAAPVTTEPSGNGCKDRVCGC
ncbi:MAG: methyltransferase [bacterium]|nr:MAG: methyltransferase [bacterium]